MKLIQIKPFENMDTGEEKEISLDTVIDRLKNIKAESNTTITNV